MDAHIRETTVHNGITRMQPHDLKSYDTLSRQAQQGYNTVADRTLSLSLSLSLSFWPFSFSSHRVFFRFSSPFVCTLRKIAITVSITSMSLRLASSSIFFSFLCLSSSHFGSRVELRVNMAIGKLNNVYLNNVFYVI